LIVVLQIVCVILSRGDLLLLGDAYAFGVVWSFAMKALSVLVLRFRKPGKRDWKVPLNSMCEELRFQWAWRSFLYFCLCWRSSTCSRNNGNHLGLWLHRGDLYGL